MEFCRLRPEGPIAGVGFLGPRQTLRSSGSVFCYVVKGKQLQVSTGGV